MSKKILFNDKFGLTKEVLEGRKTITRRSIPKKLLESIELYAHGNEEELRHRLRANSSYQVGEVVAIAQAYKDIYEKRGFDMHDPFTFVSESAGWTNKMFVKADLMPHHIRITNIRVEHLQDISDEDCLREGVEEHLKGVQYGFSSNIGYCGQYPFYTPREAFAALIDKVSGRGTWDSNPMVWVYEFELVD